jgi:O-antigen ligase
VYVKSFYKVISKRGLKLLLKLVVVIIAIVVFGQVSPIKIFPGNLYYTLICGTFILFFIIGTKIHFNFLVLWLVFACFYSIVLNDIPNSFKPNQRFIAFIMVMGLIGPMVCNSALFQFRVRIFAVFGIVIVTSVILSFFGIILNISFMVGRGGYVGLFSHSMLLGPMAAVSMLISLNWGSTTRILKHKIFFFALSGFSFITCVAAGSRSGLLGGIAGILFYFYKINQGSISLFIKIIIIASGIGLLTFPLWEKYTERLRGKIEYSEKMGDAMVTRTGLWKLRIQEFKSSPVFGVGFASVTASKISIFEDSHGRIEPGSSWLALLSMVGLFGFIPFLFLFISYAKYVWTDKDDIHSSAFLGGMLFLFVVHMMAEGYVLSAGSGLFFFFWELMGIIDLKKNSAYLITVK